ncbi:hypothetical protein AVEN_54712-1 [Araneus ventricosus]|uniref:Uncharacterized protein n=1 Tax=Araneus ventricosus TaxID=182803 RepID=A0A4Y2HCM7_ARAVE|nr:hypothetical protein AVEN_54712-1 [Araneus ventricosus]
MTGSGQAWTPDLGDLGDNASWKVGELSAIESAVTVIISNLLTVCVSKSERAVTVITSELLSVCAANLYKSYCSCYL